MKKNKFSKPAPIKVTNNVNPLGLTEVINAATGQKAFVDASKYKIIYR